MPRPGSMLRTFVLLSLVCCTACASTTRRAAPTAGQRPEAPPADTTDWPLAEFLNTSPSALSVAEGARSERMLASADPVLEPLRLSIAALRIASLEELERRLAATVERTPALLAALDRRVRGGKTGDRAHWVAVALLALDEGRLPSDLSAFARLPDWDEDYLGELLALREISSAGDLERAAIGADRGAQPVEEIAVRPPLEPAELPTATVRRDEPYWPVFPEPGSRTVSGVVELTAGDSIAWDDYRFLGRGRRNLLPREDVETIGRYRREPDGRLVRVGGPEPLGERPLRVAVAPPGHGPLVWVSQDELAWLPRECCRSYASPDGDWWLRLEAGPYAGGWIRAPRPVVDLSFPAYEAWLGELRERRKRERIGQLWRSGTLDVEAARLPYWLEGAVPAEGEEATPLFVLHGGPGLGSAYLREPLTEVLGDARRLVFYDQRGSGYATGAEDPSRLAMDWFVSDLEAMRRHSELERIDLLGHSFGGLLALAYALEHPDRVGRVVLVDPDPPTRTGWESFRERVAARTRPEDAELLAEIEAVEGWRDRLEMVVPWFAIRMRAYVADPESGRRPVLRFDDVVLSNWRITAPAMRESLGDWDLRPRLATILHPVLVVAGEQSIFDPAAHREMVALLPAGELVTVPRAGHFPFLESPEVFGRVVLDFLER